MADDWYLVREGARSALSTIPGVEVVGTAGDGDEVLKVVEETQPDSVLLDIRMPPTHRTEGIDAAKDAVGDVYGKAVRQADAEGLTPDRLGNAAQDIGQRVRRVAESAVTTAFEPQDNPQQNTNGVRDHG